MQVDGQTRNQLLRGRLDNRGDSIKGTGLKEQETTDLSI